LSQLIPFLTARGYFSNHGVKIYPHIAAAARAAVKSGGTKMLRIKNRRARIRVFSFTAAALAAAVIFAAVGLTAAHRLKMAQEYSYERALCELDEHVGSIDIALKKSMYAGTSPQLISLCAQIWSDSSAAAANISEMPLTDVDMSATVKFLSQAGDYADTLARALSQGVGLTDDEKKTLAQLSSSASRLSAQLGVTQRRIQSGSITLFKADEVLRGANVGAKPAAAYVGDSFGKIEKTFSGLPSMIYDGPFSDSAFRKTPALTQGRPGIGSAAARQKAAAFLSRQPQELKSAGVSSGTLPTYDFTCGTVSISVAKSVGFIVRMADSAAAPARERLSRSDACAKAGEALKKFGADPAAVTYSLINGGVCTVSFACVKDNVIYYPDLIKAGCRSTTAGSSASTRRGIS
jgi:spore germination protein